MTVSTQEPRPPNGGESADLFDYPLLRDWAGFALRAPLRNPLLALGCVTAVVALAAAALWALPKTYHAETRVLAQRNPVMSTLANPHFGRPFEADAPTRAARETVLRWDNLVSLVEQTDLVKRYHEARPPAVRMRDRLRGLLARRPATHEEEVEALAYTLEKRLEVKVSEGLVHITVEWQDSPTAYRLVDAALQNFLETRHASEISIVGEAISILERHAVDVQRSIDEKMERIAELERGEAGDRAPRAAPAVVSARIDDDLVALNTLFVSKRRALADLEEFRKRRLVELEAQLEQQSTIYADLHPAVVATRQSLEAAQAPSPQAESLRVETQDLEREIVRRGGRPGLPTLAAAPLPASRVEAQSRPGRSGRDDPRLENARGELRLLLHKYSNLVDRIDVSRMEMDTAQAAFKYRYSVIAPPQMPKRPIKPETVPVMAAALLGGVLLAFLAAVAADLRSGIVLERWQIERQLGLPVIAELRAP